MFTLPFRYEPRSTLFTLGRRRRLRSYFRFLVALRVLDDGWLTVVFKGVELWRFNRFNAFARKRRYRSIINASSAVDLNNDTWYQLLDTFHFTSLICFFVKFSTTTAAVRIKFPKRWTGLAVTLHQTLVDDRLLQMSAFLRRVSPGGFTSYAANDWLLRSTPAAFCCKGYKLLGHSFEWKKNKLTAWREAYHFPRQLTLPTSVWGRGVLRVCCLQLVIQRQVVFARWEVIHLGSFFGCCQARREQILIFYSRVNLLR